MKEMIFGAAYYLEYMPYDRLEEDMSLIRAAGMNTIRIAESTWSTLEPSEGAFDFSIIDKVLAAAQSYGLNVIIGTPTYAVPSWLIKKHPKIMLKTTEGRARYGHRQIFDITNPDYLKHAEHVIRALVEHTASHPQVIGFQIDNETKHFEVVSDRVQKQFVSYLKERFKTTEALNRAFYLSYWSNSIQKWEDFPDMRGCCNGGLSSEFDRFRRQLAADFLGWQASLIREYIREDQFITHNLDFEWKPFGIEIASNGYSYGVQPGISHLEVSKHVTLAGTDIYHPTQNDATGAEIAFCGDSIRSLKHDRYLVLETQAQGFKNWTPYPGQLRLDALSHLASGACGLMYWNWHSIHNGFEAYWKGVLSHDLLPGRPYREIAAFGEEITSVGAHSLLLTKKNRTAIVIDHHSQSGLKWFPTAQDFSYNDMVRLVYDSLYELNIECDIIDVNALDTKQYELILIPILYSAAEESIAKLKDFVAGGGTLVATFRSFFADEHMSIYPDLAPHGLTECFGMHYSEFTEPAGTKAGGRPVMHFMELLETQSAETFISYEHPYWKEYAAVSRNRFGKGTAWYIGCLPDKEIVKDIVLRAAEDAGLPGSVFGTTWPIIERTGINDNQKKVIYLLNYSALDRKVTCPAGVYTDLLTGKIYREQEEITLKDWGAAVLEVL